MKHKPAISSCLLEVVRMLTESYSYEYKIPKERDKRLYDFYLFTLYSQYMNMKGYSDRVKTLPGMDEDTLLDLEEIVRTSMEKLADEMQRDLLEAIEVAVAAEMRHLTTRAIDPREFLKNKGAYDEYREWEALRTGIRADAIDTTKGRAKGATDRYDRAYKALKHSGWNMTSFMELAVDAFNNLSWESSYGGEAWGDIASAWFTLKKANTISEKQLAIDHVFDLEHNNGTMLNKVNKFRKKKESSKDKPVPVEEVDFGWIKKALDAKFSMTPVELGRKSSLPMSLVGRLNRLTGALGDSVEEHDRKKRTDSSYPDVISKSNPKITAKIIYLGDSYQINLNHEQYPQINTIVVTPYHYGVASKRANPSLNGKDVDIVEAVQSDFREGIKILKGIPFNEAIKIDNHMMQLSNKLRTGTSEGATRHFGSWGMFSYIDSLNARHIIVSSAIGDYDRIVMTPHLYQNGWGIAALKRGEGYAQAKDKIMWPRQDLTAALKKWGVKDDKQAQAMAKDMLKFMDVKPKTVHRRGSSDDTHDAQK